MYGAVSPVTGQYAYVVWIAGGIVLGFTLIQKIRQGAPRPSLPRPTPAQLATMLAWAIIVVLCYLALSRIG